LLFEGAGLPERMGLTRTVLLAVPRVLVDSPGAGLGNTVNASDGATIVKFFGKLLFGAPPVRPGRMSFKRRGPGVGPVGNPRLVRLDAVEFSNVCVSTTHLSATLPAAPAAS
jgi:hypothetical protein